MIAAMPQQSPESAYSSIVCRRTLMPARRAASALPPMATVRRPKVVRFSRTQPAPTTTARMMHQQRDAERRCVVAIALMSCVGRDLGLLARDLRGQTSRRDQHRQASR